MNCRTTNDGITRDSDMVRWRILRTLLYKEALRYRYNWGLLVMIAALLAMSALISISARMKRLPGQQDTAVRNCMVVVPYTAVAENRERAEAWTKYLEQHPPANVRLRYNFYPQGWAMDPDWVWPDMLVIELI